ncbi:MAG: hypothetical protein Q9220_007052 [cf. Caloplaca sp. 1 TL-2023]
MSEFLRSYLQSNNSRTLEQRWQLLRTFYEDRPMKRRKRGKKGQNEGPLPTPSPAGSDEEDMATFANGFGSDDDERPLRSDQTAPDSLLHPVSPQPNRITTDKFPPPIASQEEASSGRETSQSSNPSSIPNKFNFYVSEVHLRLTASNAEPSVLQTLDEILKLPDIVALFENEHDDAVSRIVDFVDRLFSPKDYVKIQASMKNLSKITGLSRVRQSEDYHIGGKMMDRSRAPVCLLNLEDGWRKAVQVESLQDEHWAKVKWLILTVQSYSWWLDLCDLLSAPEDDGNGVFVRTLVRKAKTEARQARTQQASVHRIYSDRHYLKEAVAPYLGAGKKWVAFLAVGKAAHVLHRHQGLLALVPQSRLRSIGPRLLQVVFDRLILRHPSLSAVAQKLHDAYVSPLMQDVPLHHSVVGQFIDIDGDGLANACAENQNGFVGLFDTDHSQQDLTIHLPATPRTPRRSASITTTTTTTSSSASSREATNREHTSGPVAEKRSKPKPNPSTPKSSTTVANIQLPTPGRSNHSGRSSSLNPSGDSPTSRFLSCIPIPQGTRRKRTTTVTSVDEEEEGEECIPYKT